ncbi:hypothetical protein HW555_009004 [Spodoptera exigua]|uniref:Odorant receptor n=1 Tax=Spodoptera exigua TaxID=7107 RepID=A0A835GD99_SPOEX|nr:hypothetical protein HW555_009004 [Spodoptera exigua]
MKVGSHTIHKQIMEYHQINCFNINFRFFKFLGVWPGKNPWRYYNYYSKAFILFFVIIFSLLFSINFYFLPRQLDIFIEETIIYFTDLAVTSKVFTFVFMHDKIIEILDILECEVFQPDDDEGLIILEKAKKFNRTYCKIIMSVSYLSSTLHILSPLISHLILDVELMLPICRYAFISDEYRLMFIYPIYLYQSVAIHFHVLYNVNVDIFFFGLMVLAIAQLDIIDKKLRKVTDENKINETDGEVSSSLTHANKKDVMKLNQCIIHFIKICRFCKLIEDVFSATLFVQYSAASCIICVCLCRFTMSQLLTFSVYNCDWTSRSRQFKSNMRFFVDRTNKPLSVTGGKMFILSLDTFTSVKEMIFYFTDLAVTSKVLTFVIMHDKIIEILDILECEVFQPDDDEGIIILKKAKDFNKSYWKIIMSVSYLSSLVHIMSPLISHLILGVELLLPVCRYAFISDQYKLMFIYPIYLYQSASIHFHMLYNVNVDSFFLGLMVLAIAQLDILDVNLRKVTAENKIEDSDGEAARSPIHRGKEDVMKMNHCIVHFIQVCRFCELVKDVFSATLFVQFGAASCIICVCLLRFTMPAPMGYYIFLATYMTVMILQIMAPCWLGTRIMVKSQLLTFSVYNCDWTSRSRQFKSNMRFFVDRTNKPLSITGGKMFILSLDTFTSGELLPVLNLDY